MHNHNNQNGEHKGMMIWMMLPCLLLVGIMSFGGGALASSGYLWLIILGVCVVPHLMMMFRGGGKRAERSEASEESEEKKHDDCCQK